MPFGFAGKELEVDLRNGIVNKNFKKLYSELSMKVIAESLRK